MTETPVSQTDGRARSLANLRPNPNWVPGCPAPNPRGGKSPYQASLDKAIEAQETPDRVCEVIAAMREMALSGNAKAAPAAAKVYLGAVGVDMNKAPSKLDLTGAPEDLVN